MNTLIICLFVAILLPYIAKVPVAIAMHKLGGYDNHHPRQQQAKLKGFGERALAAHQNSFESLSVFAPCVLVAIATHHLDQNIILMAYAYLGFRALYYVFYWMDFSTLRSSVWFLSMVAAVRILFLSMS